MCRITLLLNHHITKENIMKFLCQSVLPKNTPRRNTGLDGEYHLYGYGFAWYYPHINKWFIYKNYLPFHQDKKYKKIVKHMLYTKPSILIGHIRLIVPMSIGGIDIINTHPFRYKNCIFVHNGRINNFCNVKNKVLALINQKYLSHIKGDTDSEHLFYLILSYMKNNKFVNLNNEIKNFVKDNNIDVLGNIFLAIDNYVFVLRIYCKNNDNTSLYLQDKCNIISSEPIIDDFEELF